MGGDVIDLSGIDADRSTGFNDAFTFLGVATMAEGIAAGAGALWAKDMGADWTGTTGARIRTYANVDDEGGPDVELRIRDTGLTAHVFTAGDFLL